jgi:hypothetical protein
MIRAEIGLKNRQIINETYSFRCFLILVLRSKNIIRNFIPMVKMVWLSGTADQDITYIRSVELNGNRDHEKN